MSLIHKGLAAIALAGVAYGAGAQLPAERGGELTLRAPAAQSTPSGRSRGATPPPAAEQQRFVENQLEFYLTNDAVVWIRPGLKITVLSITNVAPGQRPVVEIRITDGLDQPLDRLGRITPGAVAASFVLSFYDPEERVYTAYTTRVQTAPPSSPNPGASAVQAVADSGGSWTDLEMGRARYTFGRVIPAGADLSKTHSLGIYATRNLMELLNKNYFANVVHDFRPDGGQVVHRWDKIRDVSCNTCHEQLAAHGGARRDVKLCVLCHSPQSVDPDTGNTLDFNVMIHKIHRGADLPSVQAGIPYQFIGFGNSLHDFSTVHYPQDIRNCQNCHERGNPTQREVWFTQPSRAACGSCHDNINWVTGHGHAAGPQLNDAACSSCHIPDSGHEFDASIRGAHTVPHKSQQLRGLNASIVSVSDLRPGSRPTVVIRLTNNDGTPVDGSRLAAFAPMVAGPTRSYRRFIRETGQTRAVFDPATGNTTYTFTAAVPADAMGTWGVSGDFYRNVSLKRADGEPDMTIREAAMNPISYVAITGALEPRRMIAATARCNDCHDRLTFHGTQRMNVQQCVMCHNPTMSDAARRPAGAGEPESISFQRMIHRIHSGENLTQDFTVYGFGNVAHNYNHLRYPQDRRNCAACHVNNSHRLPVAPSDPVTTLRDYFSPQGPATAACLGCHDSRDAAAHAFLNTTEFGGQPAESCAVCHGTNKTWSVDRSHAR
jgi:OmcA/MtrC family decaheme c-type cytochrome